MTLDEEPRPDALPPAEPDTGTGDVHDSLVAAWKARVANNPDATALRYFDGALSAREVDAASDALAAAFEALGTGRGDRVGVYLQSVPQYALVLLALWKLGATALGLNPMYRRQELRRIVDDAGAVGVVCADTDVEETLGTLRGGTVRWLISTSALDCQSRNDPRVFATTERPAPAPDGDLFALIEEFGGSRPAPVELGPDDVAFLTYTSGTTGPPKGAMNTHGNVLGVVSTYGAWTGLSDGDVVLAVAPLFHITGAVVNAALSLLNDTTLVLAGRFHPEVALEAIAEHGVTFTIGSITAYNALYELPQAGAHHFSSVKALYSGGAPIPPATVERFRERFGLYIHNVYGMTETTSAVIAVPLGGRAPVHPPSGTLSIGLPLPHLTARVVDSSGRPVPDGEEGELELSGPQVVPGYWGKPEATRRTMPQGRLRTGDVAVIDERGWVFLVDRLKDQINVSGYKVWPREVEDALYEHPAVHEAAVIGVPDDYRGETVAAYVSLKAGRSAGQEELIAFCRERLAAYKCPRRIHLVADLPKTQSGKIRRAALRESGGTGLRESDGTGPSSPKKD
ncbi:AMP-binding protein [Streptomyces sp. NA04227]|uniref:class I adenylate-forming enzyme family protein n=1 Tax=Streptomyces sp. NA04227 TaxID=2742136 RepID=UPI0015905162|nr:AMP-binding protein [Streptomyces sp. NA04227]QKW09867.1 AMP-binding protein [Streptomyces sp. NA04227]